MTCDCNAGVACDMCGFDLSDEWALMARDLATERAAHLATRQELSMALADRAELMRAHDVALAEVASTKAMLATANRQMESALRERDEAARRYHATEAQLECVLDTHKEGGWMARALDAEADAARLSEALRQVITTAENLDLRDNEAWRAVRRLVSAALAGSEGAPQTLRKLDGRRALAERVREACASLRWQDEEDGRPVAVLHPEQADAVRALDLDALLEEP